MSGHQPSRASRACAGDDAPRQSHDAWQNLNARIVACRRCPRLIEYCATVARVKKSAYQDATYWGRPVPNFCEPAGRLLIVGLAPAAHGANRTGRMFAGDNSGKWLYRALFKAGFANQPTSTSVQDGLRLVDCAITAICHCAPPGNKPTLDEVRNCAAWLDETNSCLPVRVYLALGVLAWKAVWQLVVRRGAATGPCPKFSHGRVLPVSDGKYLVGSYHPSQQNTFTKRLTEPMLDAVFAQVRKLLADDALDLQRSP